MKPFERTMVVRGYEVDESRTTPLPVVLSFLEQLRWEWIADPAWGLAEGVHTGHFFVVRQQILELVERPRFGDALTITGALERIGRSVVVVRHRLRVDGRIVGHARVTGVWLGPDRRLARLPEKAREVGRIQVASLMPEPVEGAERDAVLEGEEARSFVDAPRHVYRVRGLELEPPERLDVAPCAKLLVRPSDCDVFAHVNASAYLRFFDDARLRAGIPGLLQRVALDYRAEALAGEALDLRLGERRPDGTLDAVLERDGTVLCSGVLGVV
ncbi:MAG: thioesterase [Myxococcota bacterium]